ncbi:MAG TPA: acyl-CoA thioesterase [Parasulfuritortus sp.]
MESYKLVLPEHLNHYGYLFGGNMLKWTDETSWIAASRDFPGCKFVTVAMDRVEFKKGVGQGAILRFVASRGEIGSSSVRYHVDVFCDDIEQGTEETVFSTTVTFVCLDDQGVKTAIVRA